MGRPLKQVFFDPIGTTFGGESVSTLTFSNKGEGYYSANVAITLSAPQLPGGTQATVSSITLLANGAINTYTIAGGSGYSTAPTVTVTGANTTPAVATSTLTNVVSQVIAVTAYIPTSKGGSSAVAGDIVKQVGSRRYKVTTAQGTGVCKLVAGAPTAGQMNITAEDDEGNTYYVTKLTEKKAQIVPYGSGGPGHQFPLNADGTAKSVPWTFEVAPKPGTLITGYNVRIVTN